MATSNSKLENVGARALRRENAAAGVIAPADAETVRYTKDSISDAIMGIERAMALLMIVSTACSDSTDDHPPAARIEQALDGITDILHDAQSVLINREVSENAPRVRS